jgi:hypothetical protein
MKILHGLCEAQRIAENAIKYEDCPDGVDCLSAVYHASEGSLKDSLAV